MNILFIIPGITGGGQEKAARLLCNYLNHYHKLTVVCFESAKNAGHGFEPEVLYIKSKTKKTGAGKLLALRKRITALRKIKKQFSPDISIAFGNSACILNYLCYTSEKKLACVRQSFVRPTLPSDSILKWHDKLYLLALKKADFTVAVCKDLMTQLNGLGVNRTGFVYNCVDENESNQLLQENLSPAASVFFNGNTIIHTGRFDPSKCHWQLVDIFCLIKKKAAFARLVLVGTVDQSNSYSKNIYRYCIDKLKQEQLKVCFLSPSLSVQEAKDADVLIVPDCSNPYPLLKQADLFAFPSAWEGFPNAVLEAMTAGLPVVSADCATGPSEILMEEGNVFGKLLPAFSSMFGDNPDKTLQELWAETIGGMLTDETTLQRMSTLSLERIEAFSAEKILPQWKVLVEKIYSS